jgi:hypothetical protein
MEIWEQLERYYPRHAMLGEIFMPDLGAVPIPADRLKPFYVTFPFSLTALQTLDASRTLHAPYFIFAINGSSTGSFRITLKDARSRQPHQLSTVYYSDIVGTGAKPGFLRRPYYVSPDSAIHVKVVDTSNAANNVTITLIGAVSTQPLAVSRQT